MDLVQASAGLQIGASETRYLFAFKDAKGMETFIESSWEAGGEVGAGVGALAGTKFWKDKDLN